MRRLTPPLLAVSALVVVAGCGAASPAKSAHQERAVTSPVVHGSPTPAAPSPAPPSQPSTAVSPSATVSPAAHVSPSPRPAAAPRTQSVIITGDSIPEDLGPMITRTLDGPLFAGHTESHPITGLVRNDYYDWPAAAARIAAEHPTTVIMMLGGNDNQPIKLPTGAYAAPATPAWDTEYARRAGLVMDAFVRGGVKRVYWLTMPTTDRPSMNGAVVAMGRAIHAAAKSRPAVTVYDTDVLLGANAGTPVIHQPDGIHLSILGSQMISNAMIGRLRIDAGAG